MIMKVLRIQMSGGLGQGYNSIGAGLGLGQICQEGIASKRSSKGSS